ncbi:CoA-transferase subunit beta [Pseudonocardia acaciae]|uniref:CoA-transferase subunit beta n=1 Tax=Pseudonocardia acaciae TaxID=551276 RepID=UPI00048E6B51|nr:CoA-transferase [Pseudonocardia acaciae]
MTTADELMTVTASRLLADHRVVFAGIGLPLVASALAKRRQAPNLTIVLEGGIVGLRPRPGRLPDSTNEMCAAVDADMITGICDVFLAAQRGFFDYGFLGCAQIDAHGNINTSVIGDADAPTVRLPGTGGANDISSLCNQTFVITTHEPRRFVERVDFVTSPGYLDGGRARERSGLVRGGPSRVITDLAVMDFEPESRRMRVRALQPGVEISDVLAATGFEPLVADDLARLAAPDPEELAMLRRLNGELAPTAA